MPIHRGPGRESESDVIERMVMAFLDQYAKDQSNMAAAMLAAVRELHAVAVAPGHAQATLMTQNWLSDRIVEHERRAGGTPGG